MIALGVLILTGEFTIAQQLGPKTAPLAGQPV